MNVDGESSSFQNSITLSESHRDGCLDKKSSPAVILWSPITDLLCFSRRSRACVIIHVVNHYRKIIPLKRVATDRIVLDQNVLQVCVPIVEFEFNHVLRTCFGCWVIRELNRGHLLNSVCVVARSEGRDGDVACCWNACRTVEKIEDAAVVPAE